MTSLHTDGAAVLALWKNGGTAAERHPKYSAPTRKALQRWNNEGGAPKSGDVASHTHHPKRPRKLNQPAKAATDFATVDLNETAPAASLSTQAD
jgi:hypothetical protein